MTGKQKCKILKEIRRQIAEQNDIRYVIEECTHKGNCRGTCPKCEWEVRMLERELEKRRAAGKKVALAGISAGFLLTSCSPIDSVKDLVSSVVSPLQGDMQAESTEGAIVETEIPGETVLEETATLAGEPVIEGLLDVPEPEIEEGEVVSEEIIEFDGVPMEEAETEDCEITVETEEEYMIAGGLLPADFEEDELILEGDIIYPPEEEEQP